MYRQIEIVTLTKQVGENFRSSYTGRADISELKIFPNDSLVRLVGDTFSQFWWYRCLGIQKNNLHAKRNFKIIPFGTFLAFVYPAVCNFRLFRSWGKWRHWVEARSWHSFGVTHFPKIYSCQYMDMNMHWEGPWAGYSWRNKIFHVIEYKKRLEISQNRLSWSWHRKSP